MHTHIMFENVSFVTLGSNGTVNHNAIATIRYMLRGTLNLKSTLCDSRIYSK